MKRAHSNLLKYLRNITVGERTLKLSHPELSFILCEPSSISNPHFRKCLLIFGPALNTENTI